MPAKRAAAQPVPRPLSETYVAVRQAADGTWLFWRHGTGWSRAFADATRYPCLFDAADVAGKNQGMAVTATQACQVGWSPDSAAAYA